MLMTEKNCAHSYGGFFKRLFGTSRSWGWGNAAVAASEYDKNDESLEGSTKWSAV